MVSQISLPLHHHHRPKTNFVSPRRRPQNRPHNHKRTQTRKRLSSILCNPSPPSAIRGRSRRLSVLPRSIFDRLPRASPFFISEEKCPSFRFQTLLFFILVKMQKTLHVYDHRYSLCILSVSYSRQNQRRDSHGCRALCALLRARLDVLRVHLLLLVVVVVVSKLLSSLYLFLRFFSLISLTSFPVSLVFHFIFFFSSFKLHT